MNLYMFVCVCSSPSNGGDGGGRQGPEGGGDRALCSPELLRFFSLSALATREVRLLLCIAACYQPA